jgi:hypothetical protein
MDTPFRLFGVRHFAHPNPTPMRVKTDAGWGRMHNQLCRVAVASQSRREKRASDVE